MDCGYCIGNLITLGITTIFQVLLPNYYNSHFHNTGVARLTGTVTVPAVKSANDFVGLGTRTLGTGSRTYLDYPYFP
ncbi:hypothetical protein [Pelotomaculum sp. FP]|uniref:hypothetical protein n=1 Tax=Pelotomaculum sp. FP TaxID=261474 RepID=UPI00186514B2|nr:hypothetical protein [Pelotomaculum sp. FP]